jgi:hypothetical protein
MAKVDARLDMLEAGRIAPEDFTIFSEENPSNRIVTELFFSQSIQPISPNVIPAHSISTLGDVGSSPDEILADFMLSLPLYFGGEEAPNFLQAIELSKRVDQIVSLAGSLQVPIDRDVLQIAAIGAGAPLARHFSSANSRFEQAADTFFQALRCLGASEEFSTRIYRTILAANPTVAASNREEAVLKGLLLSSDSSDLGKIVLRLATQYFLEFVDNSHEGHLPPEHRSKAKDLLGYFHKFYPSRSEHLSILVLGVPERGFSEWNSTVDERSFLVISDPNRERIKKIMPQLRNRQGYDAPYCFVHAGSFLELALPASTFQEISVDQSVVPSKLDVSKMRTILRKEGKVFVISDPKKAEETNSHFTLNGFRQDYRKQLKWRGPVHLRFTKIL